MLVPISTPYTVILHVHVSTLFPLKGLLKGEL